MKAIDNVMYNGMFKGKTPFEFMNDAVKKQGITLGPIDPKCKCCNGTGVNGYFHTSHFPIPCDCVITEELKAYLAGMPKPTSRAQRRAQINEMPQWKRRQVPVAAQLNNLIQEVSREEANEAR